MSRAAAAEQTSAVFEVRGRTSSSVAGVEESRLDPEVASILLIESHELARCGLEQMLSQIAFVDEARSVAWPAQASAVMGEWTPDVLILPSDVGLSEVEALLEAISDQPTKILLLIRSTDHSHVNAAIRIRAHGFLIESDVTVGTLTNALLQLRSGEMPIPAVLARRLLAEARSRENGGSRSSQRAPFLTPREYQVIELLVEGLSNKQIARRLDISNHGAKRHVANVLAKLNCPNRTMAVAVAIKEGLVSEPSSV